MRASRFLIVWCLFFFVVIYSQADVLSTEAEIWQKAVALRAKSLTLAPGQIQYEQNRFDKKGNTTYSETGRLGLRYDENGKVSVSVLWAKNGDMDATARRSAIIDKQGSRTNDFLLYFTPFDPGIQDKLERKSGTLVSEGGKTLWQYAFHLPLDKGRSFAGTARVGEDGRPYDFSFALSPLPWYFDIMEIHITFDASSEDLIFSRIDFRYKASFLFWVWNGGGNAEFDDWKWISAPPKLN